VDNRTSSSQFRRLALNSQNVSPIICLKSYISGLKQEDLFKADEPYPTELIGKFVKPISRAKSPLRSEITLSDDIEDISVLGKRDGVKGVEDAQNGKLIQKRGFIEGLTGKTGILTSITGLLLALGGIWIVTWLMKKREEEEERQKEEEWIRLKSTWKPVKWKPVKPFKEEKPPERREAMVRVWQEFKDSEFE